MSAYTTRLKLEKQVSGENSGNWGNLVNYVFNRIDSTVRGYVALSVAGSANVTLISNNSTTNTSEGADDQVHNKVIEFTGALTGAIHVFTDAVEGEYILYNNTSGAHALTFANTGHAANGVAISQGSRAIVYSNGSTVYDALTSVALTTPKVVTGINDVNGNELFKLTATGSAVNELTYNNASTGNNPTFTASGGDTNIGVSILPKGSGKITLDNLTLPAADGSANQILTTNGSGQLSFVDNSGGTDWQSSIVTASTLTAAAGNGYWINTTSNICTITLPGSPSVGDTIILVDYARTWGTNKITFNLNSLKFQGNTTPLPVYDTDGQSVTIVYSGATKGWIPTVDDDVTLETPQSYTITYLVVGGGGAGGSDSNGSNNSSGGGGGAGGLRSGSVTLDPGVTMTAVVGGGGNGNVAGNGSSGSASSLAATGLTTVTSAGGGGGGAEANNGINGGSGGGGGMGNDGPTGSYGNGNTPSVSPSQGNNGGAAESPNSSTASSGGGGGAGESGNTDGNGFGGDGIQSSIIGSATFYAGGGAGGTATSGSAKPGGDGGGGGGTTSSSGANPGTNALGGGGGGAGESAPNIKAGGTGGDGVVILSVPIGNYSTTTSGSPTVSESGGNKIIKFTGNGTYTT
jgi:hypothetical protein